MKLIFFVSLSIVVFNLNISYATYKDLLVQLNENHVNGDLNIEDFKKTIDLKTEKMVYDLDKKILVGQDRLSINFNDILIQANRFNFDVEKKIFNIYQNVSLKRRDIDILSDVLNFNLPNHLEAMGNVQFKNKAFNAFSNKVIYNTDNRILSLFGKAMVKNKKDVVKGEHLELNLNTEKVISRGRSTIKYFLKKDD